MILYAIILMTISRALWVLHDLYFWGSQGVKDFVKKIGWHNIKFIFSIAFWFSGFFAGYYIAQTGGSYVRLFLGLALIAWGAFEGMYNLLQKSAKFGDCFRYFKAVITGTPFKDMKTSHKIHLQTQNTFEFILHHCFRLHWTEAAGVMVLGMIIIYGGV